MTPLKPHVILADDHQIFRQGLRALLERQDFCVAGEAANGHEALRLAEELRPDVAILDCAMPLLNGIDTARGIHHVSPLTRTILLTMHIEEHYALESVRAGIAGYVVKTQAAEDLVRALHAVISGRMYLSPEVSGALVDAYLNKSDDPAESLTVRERQVLQLIAEGNTTKESARLLGISIKTAATHRTRIMEKLDIHETAGLVRYAIRRGMIEP